jgi:probable F420-dependent oxidoreductase
VRVSLGVPACREGTTYRPGFVDPALLIEVAQRAEACGYDALMANDVSSTPSRIREVFSEPPSFFEPLITFTYLSAKTSRIRFTTGILPVPIRVDDVVLLARQAATLDQLSGGRLTLGLGRGGWDDEWKQTHPNASGVHRGEMTLEAVAALRILFAERRATHRGRHYHFEDVETHPKPVQDPLPIWLAGRTTKTFERVGRLADGWIDSGIGGDDVRQARERIGAAAIAAGRDPARISICALYWVAMGTSHAEALAVAESSAEALRFGRLDQRTQVIGTPDEIRSRFAPLAAAGCDELSVVLQARDRAELLGLIDMFAASVAAPLRA